MDNSKKIILNVLYTQNVITENFNEILKPYEISEQHITYFSRSEGQRESGKYVDHSRTDVSQNSNTTRLVDKLLLKELVTRKYV
jgi:hypothetical protein